MMIRLRFTRDGQPIDPQNVVCRSPRVVGATRDGCVELTILPQGQGTWARRAAVAKIRQHRPLLDQLAALAALVDNARSHDGRAASSIAAKNAALLSHAHELASSIGDATIAMADTGARRIGREANDGIDGARTVIRRHPLRSVGLAALAGAIWAGVYRRST